MARKNSGSLRIYLKNGIVEDLWVYDKMMETVSRITNANTRFIKLGRTQGDESVDKYINVEEIISFTVHWDLV